jgi:hypothetical protein
MPNKVDTSINNSINNLCELYPDSVKCKSAPKKNIKTSLYILLIILGFVIWIEGPTLVSKIVIKFTNTFSNLIGLTLVAFGIGSLAIPV